MPLPLLLSAAVLCLVCWSPTVGLCDDKPAANAVEKKTPYQFAEGPETIDPATLVPEPLARKVTVEFDEVSLREIGEWIQENQGIPVVLDRVALTDVGIPAGEPITDHLDDEPLYLLLNRLSSLELDWFVSDNVLQITTAEVAEESLSTESYNVQDLLDQGISPDALIETINASTEGPWEDVDGIGGVLEWLGNVLFIRTTAQQHREIRGLFSALRDHGKATWTYDPPSHAKLREKLQQAVSADFDETPLFLAIRDLAGQAQADIRLRTAALQDVGVHKREPVSLKLADRKLGTVLRVLLSNLELTWMLQDGVMWITSTEEAEDHLQTVVLDVGDLCSNEAETAELADAVMDQTEGPWEDVDGIGGRIVFPLPKTMVVRQTEQVLAEMKQLLETYRRALATSKPRKQETIDPEEVITHYYRLDADIANDLAGILPQLVQPETWAENEQDAPGSIIPVSSGSDLVDAAGMTIYPGTKAAKNQDAILAPKRVLIIRQKRAVHKQIAEIINRVTNGDPPLPSEEDLRRGAMGGLGGGLGGGRSIGIGGGGYFRGPDHSAER